MWEILAELAFFETNRLLLRPFRFTDNKALYAILSDSENTQFIYPTISSLETCQKLLVQAFMRKPLGIWALEDKRSGCLIGAIRLENIEPKQKSAEIGYFLHRDYWRQGLMIEALKSLVFLAFNRLELAELVIKTHEENKASQALALKAGFSDQGSYKGSDRYSHRMRFYRDYRYLRKEYYLKEKG